METRIELTVEEKLELAMGEWKQYLLSLQPGDEQARAADKDRLICLARAGSEMESDIS